MAKQVNKKVVGTAAGVIALIAGAYGYAFSPDALTNFVCMFVECVAK